MVLQVSLYFLEIKTYSASVSAYDVADEREEAVFEELWRHNREIVLFSV